MRNFEEPQAQEIGTGRLKTGKWPTNLCPRASDKPPATCPKFLFFARLTVYKQVMKSKGILLVSLLAAALLAGAFAAEQTRQTGVILLDHETVSAAFAKGGPLLATNNFKIQAGRRTEPGEVEIHDYDTDIFYVLEGSATFVTGGKAVATKVTGPGETRAREISGGDERHLTKGDVIVIPKGVPHWFKEVNGPLLYYVVKVAP